MTAELSQLLFHEAYLLDSGRFEEWLALLAPDLRYWAPVRAELPRADERASESLCLPLFDETRDSLVLRVKRLGTGLAWSEIPPTRTRRMITNVVAQDDGHGRVRVRSYLMLFRSRGPDDETLLSACREDLWSGPQAWQLHERKITIDHRSVENMSLLL